jgi:hypothetical protein
MPMNPYTVAFMIGAYFKKEKNNMKKEAYVKGFAYFCLEIRRNHRTV